VRTEPQSVAEDIVYIRKSATKGLAVLCYNLPYLIIIAAVLICARPKVPEPSRPSRDMSSEPPGLVIYMASTFRGSENTQLLEWHAYRGWVYRP
jgi:hypothetical protein